MSTPASRQAPHAVSGAEYSARLEREPDEAFAAFDEDLQQFSRVTATKNFDAVVALVWSRSIRVRCNPACSKSGRILGAKVDTDGHGRDPCSSYSLTHTCMSVCMYACMYACHVCMYMHMHVLCTVYIYTHIVLVLTRLRVKKISAMPPGTMKVMLFGYGQPKASTRKYRN